MAKTQYLVEVTSDLKIWVHDQNTGEKFETDFNHLVDIVIVLKDRMELDMDYFKSKKQEGSAYDAWQKILARYE